MYRIGETVLENWVITDRIGNGGFGTVYEIQRKEFGVVYHDALKVITVPQNDAEIASLAAEGMSEADIERYFYGVVEDLVREFEIMAKLKATGNVVSYEDHRVIKRKDSIGWDILIRMELLNPLLTYAYEHPFTRRDVIQLGIDICKALELCQKYNIIHRDIKPENIFVSNNGDFKLGDFGIARTIEKTRAALSAKTGTLSYMAPEVFLGKEYGFNVDTYSLGIVLYRLLNRNRTPFLPEPPEPITVQNREMALIKRTSGEKITLPVHAQGRLGEIVLKACSYDPRDRYSSPMQMRQELEAISYAECDARLIYPDGDEIIISQNQYLIQTHSNSRTDTGAGTVGENHTDGTQATAYCGPVAAAGARGTYSDRPTNIGRTTVSPNPKAAGTMATVYAAPVSMGQSGRTQRANPPRETAVYGVPRQSRRRGKVWPWIVATVMTVVILCSLGYALYMRAAKEDQQREYLQILEQAQRYRDSQPEKAMKLYLQAQEMFPEEEAPYISYAYMLYTIQEYDACVSYVEDELALGKHFSAETQGKLSEILGAAYFEKGEYAAAASFFRLSTAGADITVAAMRDYAVSLGRLGDIQAANDVLSRMIKAGATDEVTAYVQAEIHYAQESYVTAEEGFKATLRTSRDTQLLRRALRSLAELYRDCVALDYTGASPINDPALKEAQLLEQGIVQYNLQYDTTLTEMLAMAWFDAYRTDDAATDEYLLNSAKYFQQVIDQGIQKDYLYTNLYTIYYELAQYDKAGDALDAFEEVFPDDYTPHALRAIMLITIENGKDQSARKYYQAYSEYQTAQTKLRTTDDQTYYQQVESLIQQLKDSGWLN